MRTNVLSDRGVFPGCPVKTFGWVPPAGSFLSRQEAPQECGLRRRCQKAALLKNSPGLKTNRACTCVAYRVCSCHSTKLNKNLQAASYIHISAGVCQRTSEKANPMGAPDHAVSKCPDRRIFRAGSALAPTASLLRPGRILKGGRLCRQRLP